MTNIRGLVLGTGIAIGMYFGYSFRFDLPISITLLLFGIFTELYGILRKRNLTTSTLDGFIVGFCCIYGILNISKLAFP